MGKDWFVVRNPSLASSFFIDKDLFLFLSNKLMKALQLKLLIKEGACWEIYPTVHPKSSIYYREYSQKNGSL